jgi:hypothetical protein
MALQSIVLFWPGAYCSVLCVMLHRCSIVGLETLAWALSLRMARLRTFAWERPLANLRLAVLGILGPLGPFGPFVGGSVDVGVVVALVVAGVVLVVIVRTRTGPNAMANAIT